MKKQILSEQFKRMQKLAGINESAAPTTFPEQVSADKEISKTQLKDYWVHVPKAGSPKIEKVDVNKEMYFQKGYIFWREHYDGFDPEKNGKGQLILSNMQDNKLTATLADKKFINFDESKGVGIVKGQFIIDNPKYFQVYEWDKDEIVNGYKGIYKINKDFNFSS